MAFVFQHLRRGAGRDQRVEAGYGTAGNRDEQEGEQVATPGRAGTVDETGHGRHAHFGGNEQHTQRQAGNRADLQEGGQVVTRGQQQPDRQHGGNKAVNHQRPGQLLAVQVEVLRQRRRLGHHATVVQGPHQHQEADHGNLANAARAQVAHVQTHEDGDRDRGGHGEGAPGAVRQRLDHDQGQHRQDDDHDHEGAKQRDDAGHRAHFGLDQIAQRASVTACGHEQHHEVLDCTGKHHASQDPQHAGQVAHLCGQHRTNQRTGTGNRGKVVTEQHPLVGRHIVQTVVVTPGRCHARGIQTQYLVGNEQTVVAVGNQVDTHCSHDNPQRIDGLPSLQCHITQGTGPGNGHHQPQEPG